MATPRLDAARELITTLEAASIAATLDPAVAGTRAPCVLIPPPSLGPPFTAAGATTTWRLVLVARPSTGGPDAWKDLDSLLDQVMGTLPAERAEPSSYQLPDGASHPAYVVTITE